MCTGINKGRAVERAQHSHIISKVHDVEVDDVPRHIDGGHDGRGYLSWKEGERGMVSGAHVITDHAVLPSGDGSK